MTIIHGHASKQRRLHHIDSAVEYLSGIITAKTLRSWIWRRQIETVRIGGRVSIPEDVLDKLIEDNTTPALKDAQPARTPRKTPRSHARSKGREQQTV